MSMNYNIWIRRCIIIFIFSSIVRLQDQENITFYTKDLDTRVREITNRNPVENSIKSKPKSIDSKSVYSDIINSGDKYKLVIEKRTEGINKNYLSKQMVLQVEQVIVYLL